MVQQIEVNGEQVIFGGNGALVASKSQPGGWHVVKVVGLVHTCDCKGFAARGQCRHVRVVVQIEKERAAKKAQRAVSHDRDTAVLAGPAIDPPLFPEAKTWTPAKSTKTFEELFPGYAA